MYLSPARADDHARSDELPVQLLLRMVACGDFPATKAGPASGHVPDKVSDSFFTTRPHRPGVGPAVSRAMGNAHGGRFEAANHAGSGALLRITLRLTGGAK
jgi:hypothetical protein